MMDIGLELVCVECDSCGKRFFTRLHRGGEGFHEATGGVNCCPFCEGRDNLHIPEDIPIILCPIPMR